MHNRWIPFIVALTLVPRYLMHPAFDKNRKETSRLQSERKTCTTHKLVKVSTSDMVSTATVAVLRASSSEFLGGVATGGVPLSEAGFACLGLFMQQHLAGYFWLCPYTTKHPAHQIPLPKQLCSSQLRAEERDALSLSLSLPPLPPPASSSASFLPPKLRRW